MDSPLGVRRFTVYLNLTHAKQPQQIRVEEILLEGKQSLEKIYLDIRIMLNGLSLQNVISLHVYMLRYELHQELGLTFPIGLYISLKTSMRFHAKNFVNDHWLTTYWKPVTNKSNFDHFLLFNWIPKNCDQSMDSKVYDVFPHVFNFNLSLMKKPFFNFYCSYVCV